MPSLYRIRVVIHSIHDSFVEIRGGLSYHFRSRHHTAFVAPIIPPSSPFSYHLRSAKIFQPPINQPIPKFPSFPSFPSFPAFPRFPQKFIHPQPRSARRSEQHESLDRAVCDQQTSVNFPPLPAPSVATENRQGHCLTKISIIRLIRSFIFLFAETIVINKNNCQLIVIHCLIIKYPSLRGFCCASLALRAPVRSRALRGSTPRGATF